MDIQYDTPLEVTEKQYKRIMSELKGVCCGRIENGKHFIKLWLMSWKSNVIWILETEN